MDSIGLYITVALLGAGAAYGLANKGKPKPALTAKKRRLAIICFAVTIGCVSLAVAVGMLSQNPPPQ